MAEAHWVWHGVQPQPEGLVFHASSFLFRGFTRLTRWHSGFTALADQAVVSITNFGTTVILGRVAGVQELGLFALCWSLVTISTELSAALITTPYTILAPQTDEVTRKRYRGGMLMQQMALSTVISLLVLAGAGVATAAGASSSIVAALVSTGAAIGLLGLREFARRVYFADLKHRSALVLDASVAALQFACLGLLWATQQLTASATYFVVAVLSIIILLAWYISNRSDISVQRSEWNIWVQHNWRLARWLLVSGVIWSVAMYLYPLVLTILHGTSATGTWAACMGLVAVGNPILLGLGNYVGPKMASLSAAEGESAMRRSAYQGSLLFGVLLAPVALALIGFGSILLVTVYGDAYRDGGVVVAVLAVNLLVTGLTFPYSRGLFILGRARLDAAVNVVAVAILFTVGVPVVRAYGALGAAVTLLVCLVVTGLVRIGVFESVTRDIDRSAGGVAETVRERA